MHCIEPASSAAILSQEKIKQTEMQERGRKRSHPLKQEPHANKRVQVEVLSFINQRLDRVEAIVESSLDRLSDSLREVREMIATQDSLQSFVLEKKCVFRSAVRERFSSFRQKNKEFAGSKSGMSLLIATEEKILRLVNRCFFGIEVGLSLLESQNES